MKLIQRLSDNRNDASLSVKLRRKRFEFFLSLLSDIPRPLKILDVGGTKQFWQQMGFNEADVEITILNKQASELEQESSGPSETSFHTLLGDCLAMTEINDGAFDVAFSNSVIEHVGELSEQRQMIDEMRRVAKRIFVQTPSFWFPLEPHFHVLGFQFFPIPIRAFLLQHFDLGWSKQTPDYEEAKAIVSSVTLLKKHELLSLCPQSKIYHEKFFGLTKSFTLYAGW